MPFNSSNNFLSHLIRYLMSFTFINNYDGYFAQLNLRFVLILIKNYVNNYKN